MAGLTLFFGITAYLVYLVRGRLTDRNGLSRLRALRVSGRTKAARKARWGGINVALHWLIYAVTLILTGTGVALYLGYGGWVVWLHATCALVALAYIAVHTLAHLHVRRALAAPAVVPSRGPGGRRGAAAAAAPGGRRDRSPRRRRPGLRGREGPLHTRRRQGVGRTGPVQAPRRPGLAHGAAGLGPDDAGRQFRRDRRDDRRDPRGPRRRERVLRLPLVGSVALTEARPDDQEGGRLAPPRRGRRARGRDRLLRGQAGGDLLAIRRLRQRRVDPSRRPALPDAPAPLNGRGYHYTTDGSYIDMWQWKAARGGMLGVVEDMRISGRPPSRPPPSGP